MQLTNAYLWRLAGESLALCYRAAPGYEALEFHNLDKGD